MVDQVILNCLSAGLSYALVALGFSLIFECSRFFDLAQGGIYVLSFYLAYFLHKTAGFPFVVGCAVSIAFAACIGPIVHTTIYARLQKKTSGTVPLLVTSLAILTLIQNLVSLGWGPDTKSIRPVPSVSSIELFNAHITPIQITSMLVALAVYATIGGFRQFTSWGRKLRALGDDRELAAIVGIQVDRITLITVGLASGVTALAAILAGLDTDMSPASGFPVVLVAWVATVFGGSGRIWNVFFAGMAIGLVQHASVLFAPTLWQDVILYSAILILLLARPRGLAPIRSAVIES